MFFLCPVPRMGFETSNILQIPIFTKQTVPIGRKSFVILNYFFITFEQGLDKARLVSEHKRTQLCTFLVHDTGARKPKTVNQNVILMVIWAG